MKLVKRALLAGLAAAAVLFVLAAVWVARTLADLPDVSVLKRYRPAAASEVLDRNGVLLAHFYERKFRVWIPIASVPDVVVQAVVTAEDDTFFGHKGVNYRAVWDALKHDVRKKRFARGGSTITQQMIKNVLLSREKTLARKLREFVLAQRAEDVLTKRQILEIYLNEVEWGDGIYGIEAAGRFYFDRHVQELTPAESALLAGMLPNPRYYDPFKRPEKARKRQEQVLFNMFQAKLLTGEEHAAALEEPLRLRDPASRRFDLPVSANGATRPCHLKVLEQMLLRQCGEQRLYRHGLSIGTTIDRSLQDGILAISGPGEDESRADPKSVLVVKEGTEVRALVCTSDEETIRSFLAALPAPEQVYELSALSLDAAADEAIVLSAPSVEERESRMQPETRTTTTGP
jgi:penicillin-binding protein 1A